MLFIEKSFNNAMNLSQKAADNLSISASFRIRDHPNANMKAKVRTKPIGATHTMDTGIKMNREYPNLFVQKLHSNETLLECSTLISSTEGVRFLNSILRVIHFCAKP